MIDNRTRSHRSRVAIIEAVLHVLARNGAGQLTLDAVAREAGISKGGLMHQFRTKEAIIKALLEHHITYIETFQKDYLLENGDGLPQPELSAEIEDKILIALGVREDPNAAAQSETGEGAKLAVVMDDDSADEDASAKKVQKAS